MKKTLLIIGLGILFISGCSKEEKIDLTTSGSNALAVDMGNGWEVQALTEVHGFAQNKKDGIFSARIFYTVDVITPDSNSVRSIFTKEADKTGKEKISGINLEAQFTLGSDYPLGKYNAVFNIKDLISNNSIKDTVEFKLEK